MELSRELNKRMEEASEDTAWAKKLRASETWEEYEKLLVEKGIEVPVELKEIFDASHTVKTGKLQDDELEKVSGGWGILPCPKKHIRLFCELTACPHRKKDEKKPDDKHYTEYCNLNYWKIEVPYGDGSGY